MDTDEFIAVTMRRVAASAVPPRPEALVPAPPATRRWSPPLMVAAAAVAVVAVVVGAGVLGSHRSQGGAGGVATSTSPPPATATCQTDHTPRPLPTWARTGFTPPAQPVPYVIGDRGDIAAVLWATHDPLLAPPADGRNNKILWVARVGAAEGPLRIRATSASTGQTVTRTLAAAPGPSIVDLPSAGCWSVDLTWGSRHDHLVLGYAAR